MTQTAPDTNSPSALWHEREAAAELNVTERTLQDWRYKGEGPPFVRLGRKSVRYRADDVRAWVADCLVRPDPQRTAS